MPAHAPVLEAQDGCSGSLSRGRAYCVGRGVFLFILRLTDNRDREWRASRDCNLTPTMDRGVTQMKELLQYLAKSLVENPDAVVISEEERGDTIVYHVKVHPSDIGKVIGRQGRVAKSIRHVVSAAAYRQRQHVVVDIDS